MTPIKFVIIDDEPAAIEVLKELAKQLTADLEFMGSALNGKDAIQLILNNKPDFIFLDVNMPLMNGLEFMEALAFKNLNIILTTGSASHAVKAIKLNAVDYLLKPIDPLEFVIAIEKVRQKLTKEDLKKNHSVTSKKIHLPTQEGILFLEESEILHITGMGSYCQISTINKIDKITVSKSIGQLEEKLSNYFFRCHNSHIINLNFVNSFSKKEGYYVVLKNGAQVEVSRRSKDELLKRLNEFAE